MTAPRRSEGVPHNRLTRMCDAAVEAFNAHPEHRDGDKCIVFLDDGRRGGIVLNGYADDAEAMADLMTHIEALFRANGVTMTFLPIDQVGQG